MNAFTAKVCPEVALNIGWPTHSQAPEAQISLFDRRPTFLSGLEVVLTINSLISNPMKRLMDGQFPLIDLSHDEPALGTNSYYIYRALVTARGEFNQFPQALRPYVEGEDQVYMSGSTWLFATDDLRAIQYRQVDTELTN